MRAIKRGSYAAEGTGPLTRLWQRPLAAGGAAGDVGAGATDGAKQRNESGPLATAFPSPLTRGSRGGKSGALDDCCLWKGSRVVLTWHCLIPD